MNKLFTKIASLSVGLAMAVGVGVALGHDSLIKVEAVDPTTISFDGTYSGIKAQADVTADTLYQSTDDFSSTMHINYMNCYYNKGYLMMSSKGFKSVAMFSNHDAMADDISSIVVTKSSSCSGSANFYVTTSAIEVTTNSGAGTPHSTGAAAYTYEVPSGTSHRYFAIYSTNTKYNGQIASIVVNYTSGTVVNVTGVTLDTNAISLQEGESQTLVATVAPSDASNKAVTWSTSDDKVAKVTNGKVDALLAGSATITVTTADGGFTANCAVTVTSASVVDPVVTDNTVTWDLTKKSYSVASEDEVTWNSDYASVTVIRTDSTKTAANNYLPPAYNSSRIYGASTFTIAPKTNYKVDSITITAGSDNYGKILADNATWTNASATREANVVTIVPVDGTAAASMVATGTCGMTSISVQFSDAGTPEVLDHITLSGEPTNKTVAVGDAASTDGLVVTAYYEGGTEKNVTASATWTRNPATMALTDTSVTFTAQFGGKTSNSLVVNGYTVTDGTTPIKWFFDNPTEIVSSTYYQVKGTCIGINGNSYYLQQDDHGILIYGGGSVTPPEGIAIGKLVKVTAKVTFYSKSGWAEGIFESNGIQSAEVIGDGVLPAAVTVSSLSGFESANQNTYVTFNGLRNVTVTQAASSSQEGFATAEDADGNTVNIYIPKFISDPKSVTDALSAIAATSTFDVTRGVVAIASGGTNAGKRQVLMLRADQIVEHTAEADLVQDWIDEYMHMDDPDYEGDGKGYCKSQNTYATAKSALLALGETLVQKFATDEDGKYTAALARYNEWARINHDSKPFEDDFTFMVLYKTPFNINNGGFVIIIASLSITAIAVGLYFILRKKKAK